MFSCSDVCKACDTSDQNKIPAQQVATDSKSSPQQQQYVPAYSHAPPTLYQTDGQNTYAQDKGTSQYAGLHPPQYGEYTPQTDMYAKAGAEVYGKAGAEYGKAVVDDMVAKPPPEPKERRPAPNPVYALEPVEEPQEFTNEVFRATPPAIQAPLPVANKGPDLKEPEPEETIEYNGAHEFKKAVILDCTAMAVCIGIVIFVFVQKSAFEEPICLTDDELRAANKAQYRSCDPCGSGTIVIPLGGEWEKSWPEGLRAVLYLFGLLWCFLGIAIVCDQFMAAIEKVTSQERVVWLKVHGNTKHKFHKRVWNDTVANLTLMALGSSAPEILLSCIELMGNSFFAGELGPSTIVGSAAFNLLVITAVCISAIPAPDIRKIDGLSVFGVTSTLSVFAYLWLIVILQMMSPDVVTKTEALLTFAFFPVLVIAAFLADKGYCGRGRADGSDDAEVERERDKLTKLYGKNISFETVKMMLDACKAPAAAKMTKAQYRREMMKKWIGGTKDTGPAITCGFVQPKHMCLECAGTLEVKVKLSQRLDSKLEVNYFTRDGLALAGKRYDHVQGNLVFSPGTVEQIIRVPIIDNEVWEEEEDFSVCLRDLSGEAVQGNAAPARKSLAAGFSNHSGSVGFGVQTTKVIILNDDEPGTLCFFVDEVKASRDSDIVRVGVNRINGSTGRITVKYQTIDDIALAGSHYTATTGQLSFEEGVCKAEFTITVVPMIQSRKDKVFRVKLTDPSEGVKFDASRDGGVECAQCEVILPGSGDKKQWLLDTFAIDCKFFVSLGAWKDQFAEAIYCNGSAAEQSTSTVGDWAFHLLSFFWKIIFAFIPPAPIAGGWACFVIALGMIGGVTMIVGDMAALMGCCMTIPDDITAITIVALGTSLPDTFASKSAAQHDPNADNSIGNVTGSNCVNVFLGLGLPWTIGAFYWDSMGKTDDWKKKEFNGDNYEEKWGSTCPDGCFLVPAGALSFSVAVFSTCATVCICLLLLRRSLYGGELGGPAFASKRDSGFLVFLWLVYILLSIFKSKEVL